MSTGILSMNRLLRSGDEVQIGKFRLVYYGSAQAAE